MSAAESTLQASAGRGRQAFLHGGFFFNGLVAVLLGPIIPQLETAWGVSHSQTALLFAAQFIASSAGAIVSTFHLRRSQVLGYGLIATGLAGLAVLGWPLALSAVTAIGFGLGLTISTTNLIVAEWNPHRRGAALNVLNTLWGAGAVTSPLLFALLRDRVRLTTFLLALAAAALLLSIALAMLFVSLGKAERLRAPGKTVSATAGSGAPGFLLMLSLAAMLFFYVGSENSLGGWLVSLSDQVAPDRPRTSLIIGSGFWAALVAGRAVATIALRRLSERQLFRVCLGVAGAGTVLILLANTQTAIAAGTVVAGLGLGPLFPLTVAAIATATADTGSKQTGWLFAFGGLGGAALPWLTGRVMDSSAAQQATLVPLCGLVILAAVFLVQGALAAKTAQKNKGPSTKEDPFC